MNIYYNAVLGGLGGLLGWFLIGLVVLGPTVSRFTYLRAGLEGALLGAFIGALVSAVEGLLNRSVLQTSRGVTTGLFWGLPAGALGLTLGEATLQFTGGGVPSRSAGWALLGLFVGLSEGWSHRSPSRTSYGALGGTIGGIIGGALLELIAQGSLEYQGITRGVSFVIVGACIGSLIGIFGEVITDITGVAVVKILTGPREGREFRLSKTITTIGRSDGCDVYLAHDSDIQETHAEILRRGSSYTLRPKGPSYLNGALVRGESQLTSGARMRLGNTELLFHRRTRASQ